jgi:hypothetical protein
MKEQIELIEKSKKKIKLSDVLGYCNIRHSSFIYSLNAVKRGSDRITHTDRIDRVCARIKEVLR